MLRTKRKCKEKYLNTQTTWTIILSTGDDNTMDYGDGLNVMVCN